MTNDSAGQGPRLSEELGAEHVLKLAGIAKADFEVRFDDEDAQVRAFLLRFARLVQTATACKHPNAKKKHFTYGVQTFCPDCHKSTEAWWD